MSNKSEKGKLAKTKSMKFAKLKKSAKNRNAKFMKLKNIASLAVIAFFVSVFFLPAIKSINAVSTVYEIRTESDIVDAFNEIGDTASASNNSFTLEFMNDLVLKSQIFTINSKKPAVPVNLTLTANTAHTISAGADYSGSLLIGGGNYNVNQLTVHNLIFDCASQEKCGGYNIQLYGDDAVFTMSGNSALRNVVGNIYIGSAISILGYDNKGDKPAKFIMKDRATIENINGMTYGVSVNGKVIMQDDAIIRNSDVDYLLELGSVREDEDALLEMRGNSQIIDNNVHRIDVAGATGKIGKIVMTDNAKIARNTSSSNKTSHAIQALINSPNVVMSGNAEFSENNSTLFGNIDTLEMSDHAKITNQHYKSSAIQDDSFLALMYTSGGDDGVATITLNDNAKISGNSRTSSNGDSDKVSLSGLLYVPYDGNAVNITLNNNAKISNNASYFAESDRKNPSCLENSGAIIYLTKGSLTMNDNSAISDNYNECGNGGAVFLDYDNMDESAKPVINLNGGTMANNRTLGNGGAIGYTSYREYCEYFSENDECKSADEISMKEFEEIDDQIIDTVLPLINVGSDFVFSGNRAASLRKLQPYDEKLYNEKIKTLRFSAGTSAYNNFDIQYMRGEKIPFKEPEDSEDDKDSKDNRSEKPYKLPSENSTKNPAKKFKLIAPNTGKI